MRQIQKYNSRFGALTDLTEYRKGMVELLNQQNWDFFVTLNLNLPNTNIKSGYEKLKKFHGYLDRALLGKYSHRKPYDDRTLFIAFPEHIESNLHYHLMVKVMDGKKMDFIVEAPKAWKKVITSGNIEFGNREDGRNLNNDVDRIKTAWYSTKNIWNDDCRENFIISSQFINSSAS